MNRTVCYFAFILGISLVHADPVTLDPTWTFFNPEGNSTIENQSPTGFDVRIFDTVGNVQSAANAKAITSITNSGFGIRVTAPVHGFAQDDLVIIAGSSVAAYNTGPVPVSIVVDANTVDIDGAAYTADATGGTIGPGIPGGNAVRPRVYQVHAPVSLANIGDAYSCEFDVELGTAFIDNNTADFHLFWGDTVVNSEFIGLVNLGPNDNRDDGLRMRLDNTAFNPAPAPPDDAAEGPLGVGGQSWPVEAHYPQPNGDANGRNRFRDINAVQRFSFCLVRVSATELAMLLKWKIISSTNPDQTAGDGSELYVLRYDETTGFIEGRQNPTNAANPSDAWLQTATSPTPAAAGALNQINFCGFMLHDDQPFNQDGNASTLDSGLMKFTNWKVGCENLFRKSHRLSGFVRDPANGNVSITWETFQDDSVDGSRYIFRGGNDLMTLLGAPPIRSDITPSPTGITGGFTENATTGAMRFYSLDLAPRPPVTD